jgi:5-methylcytosine-specific restriction protein A
MCLPRTVVGTICDHIIPHRGDEALFFDYDNTQLLCKPCHDAEKQRLEVRGFSDRTDSEGYPIDPLHPANRLERRPV